LVPIDTALLGSWHIVLATGLPMDNAGFDDCVVDDCVVDDCVVDDCVVDDCVVDDCVVVENRENIL